MGSLKSLKWLLLVLLLAVLVRIPLLSGSFWLDEAAQALESARPFSQQLDIAGDFQPPLLHYIIHFALYASRTEWWLRLWGALLPGLVTVAGVWWLGKRWFNAPTGILAALFLATNSFHIFYSQELRPYSLPTMLAILSWMALTNILQPDKPKDANKWWWFWSLTSLAGWYSSYLYPFVWVTQWIIVAISSRKKLFPLFWSTGVTLLGFVPWLPSLLEQLRVGATVQSSLPGWNSVVGTPWLKSLPLTAAKLIFGVLDLEVTLTYGIPTLLILGCCAWLLLKQPNFKKPVQLLPLVWLLVPLLTSWVLSLWIPVLQPKRVLYIWPAWSIVLAQVIWPPLSRAWKERTLGWVAAILLATVSIVNIIGIVSYWKYPTLQRENWRELISKLETLSPSSKTVAVFAFPAPFAPWEWYASPEIQTLSTGVLSVNEVPSLRDWVEPITNYEYVITFEYLQDLSDPNSEVEAAVKSYQYQELQLVEYPLIGFTKVWTKQGARLSEL